MTTLRSIVYFCYLCLSTLLYSTAIVVVRPFLAFPARSRLANAWGMSNLAALRTLCGLRYQVEGLEHLGQPGCIVMSKHQSAWETIALRGILPKEQTWVLKRELLAVPFFGWALRAFEPIAIDRKSGSKAVKQVIADGVRALEAGRWVVIFPEGTRVAPGERKKYGVGGALLAERAGVPVVPIAHNAGVFWRRRGLKKLPGVIQVRVGPPIATAGKKASQINQEVEAWIEAEMERLPREP